ncbi:hypothetical protein SpCBS45565_g05455 [Spizellomyces sp. 'palustris']|nr:hypothetical protein SpCBS45565_g05455 [Spizellomyces sp. 'palustris']
MSHPDDVKDHLNPGQRATHMMNPQPKNNPQFASSKKSCHREPPTPSPTKVEDLFISLRTAWQRSVGHRLPSVDKLSQLQSQASSRLLQTGDAASKAVRNAISKSSDIRGVASETAKNLAKSTAATLTGTIKFAANRASNAMSDVASSAKKSAAEQSEKVLNASSWTANAAGSKVAQSAQSAGERLQLSTLRAARRTKAYLYERLPSLTSRASTGGRKLRNWVLIIGFGGLFAYGLGTAIPHAVSRYYIEKSRHELEARQLNSQRDAE